MAEKYYKQLIDDSVIVDYRLSYVFELRYTFQSIIKVTIWAKTFNSKLESLNLYNSDKEILLEEDLGFKIVDSVTLPSLSVQNKVEFCLYSYFSSSRKKYSDYVQNVCLNKNSSKILFNILIESNSSLDTFNLDRCKLRLSSLPFSLNFIGSSNILLGYLLNHNKDLTSSQIKEKIYQKLIPYNCLYIQRFYDEIYQGILAFVISNLSIVNNRRFYILPAEEGSTPQRLEEGSITISLSGGQEPFFYKKSTDTNYQSSNIFANLAEGTYQINAKDSNNVKVTSDEVSITSPREFKISSFSQSGLLPYRPFGSGQGTASVSIVGGVGPYQILLLTKVNGSFIQQKNEHLKQTQTEGTIVFTGLDATLGSGETSVDYLLQIWDVYGKVTDLPNYILTRSFTLQQVLDLSLSIVGSQGPLYVGSYEGFISILISGGSPSYRVTLNHVVSLQKPDEILSSQTIETSSTNYTFTGLGVDFVSEVNTLTTGVYQVIVVDSLGSQVSSTLVVLSIVNQGDYNVDYGQDYN